jgi:hypothetical protein
VTTEAEEGGEAADMATGSEAEPARDASGDRGKRRLAHAESTELMDDVEIMLGGCNARCIDEMPGCRERRGGR